AEQHAGRRGEREAGERAVERGPGLHQPFRPDDEPAELPGDAGERREDQRAPEAATRRQLPDERERADQSKRPQPPPPPPSLQASRRRRAKRSTRSPR